MFFLCITVQPRPLFAAQALSLPLLAAPDTAGNVNIFTQKLNNFRIYRYFIFSHWGSSNIGTNFRSLKHFKAIVKFIFKNAHLISIVGQLC